MRVVASVGIALLGGCIPSTFVCAEDEQCSRAEGGRCEAGGACSYPDAACESGRRVSPFGRSDPSACVPVPEEDTTSSGTPNSSSTTAATTGAASESTTSDDASESSSASGPSVECDENCSGHGQCVQVDGDPTCACDPGWTMVGLECLEDPCEQVQCYFVDAAAGDNEGPGSRESPWQTQTRAWEHLERAAPGDHILFRRGHEYAGGSAPVNIFVNGTGQASVVIGAYGPPAEPRPHLSDSSLRFLNGEHVVLRDLSVTGTGDQPCLNLINCGFFTMHDNEIAECGVRGIRVMDRSDHVVIFRNEVRDTGARSGISVADDLTPDPPLRIGSHHWVVDNTVRNNDQFGIDVLFDPSNHVGGDGDVKVLGNQVEGTERSGVRFVGGSGWVEQNVIVGNANALYAGLDVGGDLVQVLGNTVAWTGRGLMVRDTAAISGNTVYLSMSLNVVFFAGDVSEVVFTENLLFAQGGPALLYDANNPGFAELGRNVYAREEQSSCRFNLPDAETDLAGWQEYTGMAASSRCDVVPGLDPPPMGIPVDDEFWDTLTPAPGWDGCDAVGAVRCDGVREPVVIEPLPQIDDNGGRGWEGPLIIQQHYPL